MIKAINSLHVIWFPSLSIAHTVFGGRLKKRRRKIYNSRANGENEISVNVCTNNFMGNIRWSLIRNVADGENYLPFFLLDQVSAAPFLSNTLSLAHSRRKCNSLLDQTHEIRIKIVTVNAVIIDSIRVDCLWNANLLSGCQSVLIECRLLAPLALIDSRERKGELWMNNNLLVEPTLAMHMRIVCK